jgi:outer membrane protein OmpA-like peptidoglycan-associated protein
VEEHDNNDHLSGSLTDLMTSLMVIFILLLLVFVSHTANKDAAVADVLLRKLRQELVPQGFEEQSIRPDPRDRNAILVIVPGRLMNFELQRSTLQPAGATYLQTHIPQFAAVLCSPEFRSSIDSIVVEGHTDSQPWVGRTLQQSENENLKLSQERSMAVVEESMSTLDQQPEQRTCFLEKLSATGRGQQDLEPTADESRRVIFRIRVKANEEHTIERKVM